MSFKTNLANAGLDGFHSALVQQGLSSLEDIQSLETSGVFDCIVFTFRIKWNRGNCWHELCATQEIGEDIQGISCRGTGNSLLGDSLIADFIDECQANTEVGRTAIREGAWSFHSWYWNHQHAQQTPHYTTNQCKGRIRQGNNNSEEHVCRSQRTSQYKGIRNAYRY